MKEKRRNNEKRKEKSRDAARCRRSRETDIFTELGAVLPIPQCEAANLDKASVMRLAIAYLKTRTLMDSVPKPLAKSEASNEMDELFLKAMDGFMLVLDNNGDMAYLSPNVKDYLGIAQMDLMGQSVFDYSHPCDHDEIRESFSIKASEVSEDHPCSFFLRLKCTLTSKGRKVNLKSASYKVIHCTGRVIAHKKNNNFITNSNNNDDAAGSGGESENPEKSSEPREADVSLAVVATPVPHPSNIETPLGKYTFLSKHNLNMKFTYADDKLAEFLGWDSNDLMGQSVFDFYHAQDNMSLDKSFKSLFHKGQCETMAYRFLNKSGGYAWVVTQATLIHCSRLQKPLSVVCVNYLLSGVENEDEICSLRQLEARDVKLKEPTPAPAAPLSKQQRESLAATAETNYQRPVSVTASLFRFQERPKPLAQRGYSDGKENDGDAGRGRDIKPKATIPVCEVEPRLQQQDLPPPPAYVPPVIDPPLYQVPLGARTPPQTATASIFAPRTKDMNKGFLTFSDDQPGLTMLKDEPEDLTHLAPTAGDVCVPLDDPPFLSDMLDEFILNSNYCPLLSPELPSTDLSDANSPASDSLKDVDPRQQQQMLSDPLRQDACSSPETAGGDPFIYRDSSSRCSLGTDLHSPTLTKSPDDSLSSPNESGDLSEDEMLMLSISDVMADDELSLRAPYIPMSDQDEALQMLISDDVVMWGSPVDGDKKSKWLTDMGEENANSSLAQLLTNEASSKKMMKSNNNQDVSLVNSAQVIGLKNQTRKAEHHRTNKRVYSSKGGNNNNQDTKRVKHSDNGNNLESILTAQNSQLLQQLINQQQQQQQMTKAGRNWQDQLTDHLRSNNRADNNYNSDNSNLCRLKDDGGGDLSNLRRLANDAGGKTMSSQQQQQQSNSVLMNLLVSGCDIQNLQLDDQMSCVPATSPNMILKQDKLSPIQMNFEDQLQTVPQWTKASNNISMGKQQPMQQHQQQQLQEEEQSYEPMGCDEDFNFMVTANMPQNNDDLLQALEQSLA